MWEKRKKEEQLGLWIEAERERLSARAYALEDAFLREFFAQCVESTQMRMRFFWKRRLRITIFGKIWGEWMKKRLLGFLSWQQFIIRFAQSAVGKVDWTGHACGQG